MRPLKTRGLAELRSLRARARKAYAMERISRPDFAFIDEHLNEVEARIVEMREENEYGEEVEDDNV